MRKLIGNVSGPPRFEGDRPRFGDRDGYRSGPRGPPGEFGGEKGEAPANYQPAFRVVGQYVELNMTSPGNDSVSISEALETTTLTTGDKPVDQSDATSIQASEVRASGYANPSGVAAAAQSVADLNAPTMKLKTKQTG
ncbi:late embryogenesis abundant protein D-34-like [Apium graveolens]|uniref:late embryogenesis abundant protein D-34-like n=1 Tax=Apium graveolens TaxID=4045 RepID=UPI003D7938FA